MINEQPENLDLRSHTIADDIKQELLQLFPEIRTEGGKIDFERLKLALGETVDVGRERYGMNWPGKADCFKTIQQPSMGTLLPCKAESVDFDTTENMIIEGDNLEVLKLLQKSYLGKVKMIYIDPPYNTGNDFIYPDNYTESLQTYLEYTGQVDNEGKKYSTNTEADGRFHSKWMNMMYPRLYLARNLLTDTGVLFVSIDENEFDNLIKLLDETFGAENRCAVIGVINNLKGRNARNNVSTCHEYLLAYGKSQDALLNGLPLTDEQRAAFKYTDESGEKYSLRDLRKRGGPDKRTDRPAMFFPIFFNQATGKCSIERASELEIEILPLKGDSTEGRWRWGKKKVTENLGILEARFSNRSNRWDIDHRVHLTDAIPQQIEGEDDLDEDEEPTERSSKSKSFWMGGEISTDVAKRTFKEYLPEVPYDYPKSVGLITRMIHMACGSEDIVLDFFAGSGTTAHAVLEQNNADSGRRKFILVQLPEKTEIINFPTLVDITKERVRRVIKNINHEIHEKHEKEKKVQEEKKKVGLQASLFGEADDSSLSCDSCVSWLPDLGFKVFKLSESNFKTWNPNITTGDAGQLVEQLEAHIDHIKQGRTQDDILYEILLKSGFPLSTKVETLPLAGKTVYSIAEGAMLICLERNLTQELIKAIADKKPMRVVCLDEGFTGNDQLKTNAVQTMKAKGVVNFRTV